MGVQRHAREREGVSELRVATGRLKPTELGEHIEPEKLSMTKAM
jgi:hypothetical protein